MENKEKDKNEAGEVSKEESKSSTAVPPSETNLQQEPRQFDDFGLPIRKFPTPPPDPTASDDEGREDDKESKETRDQVDEKGGNNDTKPPKSDTQDGSEVKGDDKDAGDSLEKAQSTASSQTKPSENKEPTISLKEESKETPALQHEPEKLSEVSLADSQPADGTKTPVPRPINVPKSLETVPEKESINPSRDTNLASPTSPTATNSSKPPTAGHKRDYSHASTVGSGSMSEFSHQHLTAHEEAKSDDDDHGWQVMPSYAPYDLYDDDNKLIAKEHDPEEDDMYDYSNLGGAGKGYTRVQLDEDVQSATSMDENTQYLFKDKAAEATCLTGEEEEEARDAVSQMEATKDMLTEGQRIAYVGVVRLEIANMVDMAEKLEKTRRTKRLIAIAAEALKMWGQKMMIRLYTHMDINSAEQVMIEQLGEHGVIPADLTPTLVTNSTVANPNAERKGSNGSPPAYEEEKPVEAPPPYEKNEGEDLKDVKDPSQLPTTQKIDIDLRWTVLCDLFLVLIADSIYDARSRVLLERVGKSLDISWIDICKFEKKVTDALEMQQQAERENWNEEENMESRRKAALKRRYMLMGLATVGGGLVIGLSAGLLAPVIGAGLAAGFTTIGVSGTTSFLAGAGGAAMITSGAAVSGSFIGGKAAGRRLGSVKTFEYRPLHNNKRVNLIITVSGWLAGNADDVRLPYSTVNPVMGDIYSVLWEPEMLKSMGDTINILATEALTQGLQQILGSTILVSLMAALQLPIVLTKLSYLIDNPWAVSLDRATAAGKILADSIIERNLGTRPVTLLGYSLGARVIHSCLLELSKKGAVGLVQNVYMFGSPVVVKKEEYLRARTVVSGRLVNGFNRNDWILGYLFRLTNGGIRRIAGLAAIEEPWIENMDVTELVPGHMEYRTAMPLLLMNCGWTVDSEEFTEIEDPDPENHNARQREIINEIEEARKELEAGGKKKKGGAFAFFTRRGRAERKDWEVYEDRPKKAGEGDEKDKDKDKEKDPEKSPNTGVLFDVDAIRAELAKEAYDPEVFQIREIQSTLPPMKLELPPAESPTSTASTPRLNGRGSLDGGPRAINSHLTAARNPTGRSASTSGVYSQHEQESEGIHTTFDNGFDSRHDESQRPEMKSTKTAPNIPMHDPWADPDDDDFGKEKEISMTFA